MMHRLQCRYSLMIPVLLVISPLWLFSQSQPAAATSIDRMLDPLFSTRFFEETAISPDGARAAWVESLMGKDNAPSDATAIYVADLSDPNKARRISAGDGSSDYVEQDLAWAPDNRHLAFLSDKDESGQLQLYIADVTTGSTRKLSSLKGYLSAPRWSPDGKTLSYLLIENAPRVAGPLQPRVVETGVIEEHPAEQRLGLLDVATGKASLISPADMYVYEYDWSPDGKNFAAIAARGNGDNNWWIAQLYTLSITGGGMKSIFKPPLQIAFPRWSPDGRSIAFIGGLMSDAGVVGGDVFVVPAAGGEARNVTPDMKASASWLTWPSPDQVLFTENIDGMSGVAVADPSGGSVKTFWSGAENISASGWSLNLSLAKDGKTSAVIRQSYEQPPEVWAGRIGSWKPLTQANASQKVHWGEAKSIHWNNDGMTVQGWLLYPRNYDPARKYPLVVSVHGGPASAVRPRWPGTFFDFAALSSQGYFVLFPNPRGSYGQGEKFTQANVKDFGYGDLRDIETGVDEITQTLPVDPHRVGIGGWSYGGFMTMWTVTQTHRFRAAVAGAGIANWQSYYGENGIDQWMIPFFGASVYDDPAVYARSSPITFIKHVKTPTLILVGDSDEECPTPQSYEFWHALKTLGVKTQLVVYQHEGHMIGQPEHRRDIMRRTVEWFDENMR